MRAALVDSDGTVISAIVLDDGWDQPDVGRSAWQPPEGILVVASDVAGTGWTWDGTNFIMPASGPDTVPEVPPVEYARNFGAEIDALTSALITKSVISEKDISDALDAAVAAEAAAVKD